MRRLRSVAISTVTDAAAMIGCFRTSEVAWCRCNDGASIHIGLASGQHT
jgi:hypothetical protein